jgi:hypothetical protein
MSSLFFPAGLIPIHWIGIRSFFYKDPDLQAPSRRMTDSERRTSQSSVSTSPFDNVFARFSKKTVAISPLSTSLFDHVIAQHPKYISSSLSLRKEREDPCTPAPSRCTKCMERRGAKLRGNLPRIKLWNLLVSTFSGYHPARGEPREARCGNLPRIKL